MNTILKNQLLLNTNNKKVDINLGNIDYVTLLIEDWGVLDKCTSRHGLTEWKTPAFTELLPTATVPYLCLQ